PKRNVVASASAKARAHDPTGHASRAISRQASVLTWAPRSPSRCGGLHSVMSGPNSRCERSSIGADTIRSAMPRHARWKRRVPTRAPGRLMGRILPATGPGQQVVERARVEDLRGAEPGAPGDGDAEVDVVELGEVVRVGADRERHACLRRAPRVDVVEVEPLG